MTLKPFKLPVVHCAPALCGRRTLTNALAEAANDGIGKMWKHIRREPPNYSQEEDQRTEQAGSRISIPMASPLVNGDTTSF
jgi:hypothetical protein